MITGNSGKCPELPTGGFWSRHSQVRILAPQPAHSSRISCPALAGGAFAPMIRCQRRPAMDITRAVAVATRRGRGEWFTGTVWQDPIVEAPEPARVKAVRVTFEP